MAKLDLTPEREAIIKAAAAEWLSVGRSTAPADFDRAEAAITRLYAAIGKPAPRFARFHSPLGAELFLNLVNKTWPGELGANLRDNLRANLWANLGDNIGDNLVANKLAYHGTSFWGGWDYYLMWLDGGARIGAPYPAKNAAMLADHMEVCRSIGWWYAYENVCLLCDRPEILKLDAEGRLHCDDGPALSFRDGYSLWALHGLRLDRKIIEAPETLTFEDVRDERNAEVRRHMLERFGGLYDPDRHGAALEAWIKAGNLKPISSEDITAKMQPSGLSIWRLANGDKPVTCDLYRAELPDDEPLHLLTVVCTSTAKMVPLRVPPTIFDAAEARRWTFRGADLAEAVET